MTGKSISRSWRSVSILAISIGNAKIKIHEDFNEDLQIFLMKTLQIHVGIQI